jgi:hypothetical protein
LPLVTITHTPAMTGNLLERETKRRAKELQERAAAAGYSITLEEAEIIIKDALTKGDAGPMLEDLKRALDALTPSVEELIKVL